MMTWEECAAAGLTRSEAARHRGVTRVAAYLAGKRKGIVFKVGKSGPPRQPAPPHIRCDLYPPVRR